MVHIEIENLCEWTAKNNARQTEWIENLLCLAGIPILARMVALEVDHDMTLTVNDITWTTFTLKSVTWLDMESKNVLYYP